MKTNIFSLAIYVFVAALSLPQSSFAQIGYDNSFNGNGLFLYNEVGTQETVVATLEQPDGKVVIVLQTDYDPDEANNSRILVIRLNHDGAYDNIFGSDGKVYIDTPNSTDVPIAATLQPDDGKILIAGYQGSYKGTIYRLNPSGSFDTAFGSGGKAVIAAESVYQFRNIKLQSNGKIVVSGHGFIDSRFCYLIARFNTNGQLDNTFNAAGGTPGYHKFRTSTSSTEEDNNAGWGLAIQFDGKIVSCGFNEKYEGTVVRLNVNGTLDPSFDNDGYKILDNVPGLNRDVSLFSVVSDCNGKIVVGGYYDYSSSLNKALIMRFLSNGNSDLSFSADGYGLYGNDFGMGYGLALQCDCKYVIGGGRYLTRVKQDGTIDGFFGQINIDVESNFSPWAGTLFLGPSKIYLGGYYTAQSSSTDQGGFVLRFNNDIDCGAVSSEEMSKEIALKIYPNPVSNQFTVAVDEETQIENIRLMDQLGRVVYSNNALYPSAAEVQCDISTLSAGMYYLEVVTTEGQRTLALVKI